MQLLKLLTKLAKPDDNFALEEVVEFEAIQAKPLFHTLWAKAVDKYQQLDMGKDKTSYQHFLELNWTDGMRNWGKQNSEMITVPDYEENDYCSVPKTACLIQKFCDRNGIDISELVASVINILDCRRPKVNVLYLQGQSNAGKTWLLESLLPEHNMVGEYLKSSDFAWMNCPDKQVIHCAEMTIFDPEQMEICKQIFEGKKTMIYIKNKPGQWMGRTPVLIRNYGTI